MITRNLPITSTNPKEFNYERIPLSNRIKANDKFFPVQIIFIDNDMSINNRTQILTKIREIPFEKISNEKTRENRL